MVRVGAGKTNGKVGFMAGILCAIYSLREAIFLSHEQECVLAGSVAGFCWFVLVYVCANCVAIT